MTITLSQVRSANPNWFTPQNKRFFGDVKYLILNSKGKAYLVQYTYAWTDMFGQPKKLHLRVHSILANLKVGPLHDRIFNDLNEVKNYIKKQ